MNPNRRPAAALIDRLMHHCRVANIRGYGYRTRAHTDPLRAEAKPSPNHDGAHEMRPGDLAACGKSPAAFDRPCIPYHLGLRPKPPAAASGDPFAPRRVRRGALCAPWATIA